MASYFIRCKTARRAARLVCQLLFIWTLASGHRAVDEYDDYEVEITEGARNTMGEMLNVSNAKAYGSGSLCCCKRKACTGDGISADQIYLHGRPITDVDGTTFCCKQRTYKYVKTCDKTTAYRIRLTKLDIADGWEYDSKTCNLLAAPNTQTSIGGGRRLVRRNSFECISEIDCSQLAEHETLPDDWSQKPLICRSVHKALALLKPVATQWFDTVQGTGVANTAKAVANVEMLGNALKEVAGPLAIVGGFTGAIINIMKLMDGVCMAGWSFLGSCGARVSMTAIAIAVTGLSLTFTGVGVPLSSLLLGLSTIAVRRLGPMMCQHGVIGTLKTLGQSAYHILHDAFLELGDKLGSLRLQDLPRLAKQAAVNFFKIFWSLLRDLGLAIAKGVSKVFKDTVPSTDDNYQRWACCALKDAQKAFFVDIPVVEEELDEELIADAGTGDAGDKDNVADAVNALQSQVEAEPIEVLS